MAIRDEDFGLWLINFDPGRPNPHLFASAAQADLAAQAMQMAKPVPWPTSHMPKPDAPAHTPTESSPLPQRDVLVVTWTAGEARTLGSLVTGGNYDSWYEYRHNVNAFVPKVTGPKAPFNDKEMSEARYHHSLGLYYPFKIGNIKALAFKSGLHMAYDGPAVPVVDLWKQIITEVKPKLVITTGTGGGIGSDIKLGDVVIGANVRFDLTSKLKTKPYATTSYRCSSINETKVKSLITDALLKPNGELLDSPRIPRMIYPSAPQSTIVSTDVFAFDDSTDYYKLQNLGKCCDMGDATLGLAMSQVNGAAPKWIAIRNASDPQIPNPNHKISEAHAQSTAIYAKYQCITTAGSVIASWAVAIAEVGT
jgi:nucleoside phosphorylase